MDQQLLDRLSRITVEEQRILDSNRLDPSVYTDSRDFTVDSARMLEKGRLIALRPHTRFVEFPDHRHNYIEITCMCTGETRHMVNGSHPVTLRAGELLFLSRHASHSIEKAEREDVAVNLIILPRFFDAAHEMMDSDNVLSRFIAGSLKSWEDSGDISHLHFRAADVPQVQNLVENLIRGIVEEEPNGGRISRITMGLLFLQLLNHTDRIRPGAEPEYQSGLVIAVLRDIEENYRTCTLSALAEELNQSVSRLSKLVKAGTGSTFRELLQEKRLSKTAQLLTTTTLPVRDICAWVGYENTSYFHRAFRQAYGASPACYRRERQGK